MDELNKVITDLKLVEVWCRKSNLIRLTESVHKAIEILEHKLYLIEDDRK